MNSQALKIGLLEDNDGDARLIQEMLREPPFAPFELNRSSRLEQLLERVESEPPDILLLDLSVPDSQGLATFHSVNARAPKLPIIIFSGADDEELATETVALGAQDYLVKGQISSFLLKRAIRYAIERKHAADAVRALNERQAQHGGALAELTRVHALNSGDSAAVQCKITELTARTLGVERVSIWRYQAEKKALICNKLYSRHAQTYSGGMVVEEKDYPAYFRALTDFAVIAADDARTDPRTAEFAETYRGPAGINSILTAPIYLHKTIAGVFCCEHVGEPRHWTPDEQTFVISVANLVSLLFTQEAEQKLDEQFRQAQKMEAIGQLAGGIAHDFNNILGAIIGYTALAKNVSEENQTAMEYLDQVELASERATELVTQILAFSRRQEQERKPTQLKHIVSETLKLLRASVPSTIAFEFNLLPTPPVLANPTAIHQVVMNLCTNAWHAMRDQPGTLRVELEPFEVDQDFAANHPELQTGRYVRFSVSDSGCGMSPATIRQIFEPFFTTKAPGEGTGLGLAAVHGIMKSHDGGISVYSQPGEGTTFHLYFPAFEAEPLELKEELEPIPRGHGERILFVDDEEPLAVLGQRMLERLGYAVTTKTSVAEAIAIFTSRPVPFDLVVTDLTMPEMDGIKFARELWRINPRIPIILTTGYSGTLTRAKARELGFRELLHKPNTARTLGYAIDCVLDLARIP